jgi:hypothetical protein
MELKGLSPTLSFALIAVIGIAAIGLVLRTGYGEYSSANDAAEFMNARDNLMVMDEKIRSVAQHDTGTITSHTLAVRRGSYRLSPARDTLEYTLTADLNVSTTEQGGLTVWQDDGQITVTLNYSTIDIVGTDRQLGKGRHTFRIQKEGVDRQRPQIRVDTG